MPSFVPVFLVVTNWALMVHVVVAQVDPPKNSSETTSFLQESGFGGFRVQWNLFGHICGAQQVFGLFCYFSVAFVFFWCFVLLSCCLLVVVNVLLLLLSIYG